MKNIVFIDSEIDIRNKTVLDIGAVTENGSTLHSTSIDEFLNFITSSDYLCGHNIINHDLPCLERDSSKNISNKMIIDTLYLSPLLFPAKPYHALLKDDKLQTDELNNPLNDAKKAKDLFYDEVSAFRELDDELKRIDYALLRNEVEFASFFDCIGFTLTDIDIVNVIQERFRDRICQNSLLSNIIRDNPIELAYCLALINVNRRDSITPPWVIKTYSKMETVMYLLRNKPCLQGCSYCNRLLDGKIGLKKYFGFDSFKKFGDKSLQEDAVNAAIRNQSILAVFPTGGGKSITFQVPALISGENVKGLTVVISPLQSLMKDQVDNLENKNIMDAVTINGLLDPIERAKSFERVENGSASILYIAPESLRSKSIERLLLGRNVVRFVIDEAHCFSTWGQEFRVDYLYIGRFIKSLQEKKNLEFGIPVSCFTATAKQKVIQDITNYFEENLSMQLETFSTTTSRTNLNYKVIPIETDLEKYILLRNLLDGKNCPAIIYVSRTRKANLISERLMNDGYMAKPYHGKMDKREKIENQDAFIRGDIDIIVATSAFGMGVDKKNVGIVIHYDLSDSIENYIQEAGRAGRDENITADCYVLFNEEDLNNHFTLLNQTKINIKEIQQIWKAIKNLTRSRSTFSKSALEIARTAGWDDNIEAMETRVATAISALEEVGFLQRKQNMPGIFADGILAANTREAVEKIDKSDKFDPIQKQQAIRIIQKLISSRSRKHASDVTGESRIDYISDHLGIKIEDTIHVVNLLREEKVLSDTKDITAYINRRENKNHSLTILNSISRIERFLATQFTEEEKDFHIKELNEQAEKKNCSDVSPRKIKTIINFWVINNWVKKIHQDYTKNNLSILSNYSKSQLMDKLATRHELAGFIIDFLFLKSNENLSQSDSNRELSIVEFSVNELKEAYINENALFKKKITVNDIEDALYYLSRIDAIKIEGGFLVIYNRLIIERTELDNNRRYKIDDYKILKHFYDNKIQQIHIVGEYARKMIQDYNEALQFVDDYFYLNYSAFLKKYFKGNRKTDINRNITPGKFRQIFGELSPAQLSIINDRNSQYIVVAAGPGSGKTRILVHKLASLLLMEDVKHEQLLMLTFSRATTTEFKKRLIALIGKAACYVDIKTFHSYCFDLLGKVGTIEKSQNIIQTTVEKIRSHEIETNRITKAVLVIDEAQDMDKHEFELIKSLMAHNEEMRIIAVGDDDQCIFSFRGASPQFLGLFISEYNAMKYELVENYRSKSNLVEMTNQFVEKIQYRLKKIPIVAQNKETGVIKVIKHSSLNLVEPLVSNVLESDLNGTTCVLTQNNIDALQISGQLIHQGLSSKLIQTNDGFKLQNMLELRYFIDQLNINEMKSIISDENWKSAKMKLWVKYRDSNNIDICINIIKDFESIYPKIKYKSDFEIYVMESKLEDFIRVKGETIFVSTIHKAKGKEFDNIYLILNEYNPLEDSKLREIYVAMTRAKQNLVIHINGNCLDNIHAKGIIREYDNNSYNLPQLLFIQLTHKDIWLDYYTNRNSMKDLKCGDDMKADNVGCKDSNGRYICKYSKNFKEKINSFAKPGYKLTKKSRINYLLYWKNENAEKEIIIVLPELVLERQGVNNVLTDIAIPNL